VLTDQEKQVAIQHVAVLRVIKRVNNLMKGNHMERVCMEGSCLQLGMLLREVFGGDFWVMTDLQHAALEINGKLYDITGEIDKDDNWRIAGVGDLEPFMKPYSLLTDLNKRGRKRLSKKHYRKDT
jgi:hypothetical protein